MNDDDAHLSAFTITPYERAHRSDMLMLLLEARHTHTHLDWYTPLLWLENADHISLLAWQGTHLAGFISCSAPLNGASWMRLVALSHVTPSPWALLWHTLRHHLRQAGANAVYALLLDTWLTPLLTDEGFLHLEEVVTLYRPYQPYTTPPSGAFQVQLAYSDDLEAIVQVDNDAFAPPWQLTRDELRLAMRQAASSAVARHEGQVIGYQISTRHQDSGHLARLAVAKSYQAMGVGGHLLAHLLQSFERRHIRAMTVNTQQSNLRSQRLYTRYGFQRNGFDMSVWRFLL